jgi:hypothetical protein
MAEWKRDQADYKFQVPGYNEVTQVSVTGAMNPSESNRPKLIIEDRTDNRGPSVLQSPAKEQCITSLSNSMKIEPQEADWYARGKDGQLQALSIDTEKEPNKQFEAWQKDGEFSIHDTDKAKRFFPDDEKMKATAKDLTPKQDQEVKEAFGGLEQPNAKKNDEPKVEGRQKAEETKKVEEPQKAGHEYDLSQEQIRSR